MQKQTNDNKSVSNEPKFNECSKLKKISKKQSKSRFNAGNLQKMFNTTIENAVSTGDLISKHKKSKIRDKKGQLNLPVAAEISSSTENLLAVDAVREKLASQVQSANFRILNERLYTSKSSEAFDLFKKDREAFKAYHEGYSSQVDLWPLKPLSLISSWLRKKPKMWKVADFGCGEALLSKSVPQKVISLDLVSSNPKVIECDMAHTPLLPKSMDVVVFCLSLMGTNIGDFITEANRVLKNRGVLKIAEVESRFENITSFMRDMKKLGFRCINKNQQNKYFWLFDFLKEKDIIPSKVQTTINLRPCMYKKR